MQLEIIVLKVTAQKAGTVHEEVLKMSKTFSKR